MHFNSLPDYVMRTVFFSLTSAIFVFVVMLLLTPCIPRKLGTNDRSLQPLFWTFSRSQEMRREKH